MAEISKGENLEAEKTPEEVVNEAVSEIEKKEAADALAGSDWNNAAKGYIGGAGKLLAALLAAPVAIAYKITSSLLKFTGRAVKGKMSLSEGSKIGEEIFSSGKKEKKPK